MIPYLLKKIRANFFTQAYQRPENRLAVRSNQHWAQLENHSKEWNDRSKMLASMLTETDGSVFEFGAGQLALSHYLPKNITYYHHDLAPRNEFTYIFDLNVRPLPTIPHAGAALFSGVLEYIENIPEFVIWLSDAFPVIIASYVVNELGGTPAQRANMGWINNYTEGEFVLIFKNAGYDVKQRSTYLHNQVCFRFAVASK